MKNLKPFDLQAALSGKAVMLRNGKKAYVRHHETEVLVEEDMRLIGLLPDGILTSWCESGHHICPDDPKNYDIIGMYPETRVINGFEVPAPEAVPLDEGDYYHLANPLRGTFYSPDRWISTASDRRRLERGLVFLNKEDAIATAKAMLGIDPYKGDE